VYSLVNAPSLPQLGLSAAFTGTVSNFPSPPTPSPTTETIGSTYYSLQTSAGETVLLTAYRKSTFSFSHLGTNTPSTMAVYAASRTVELSSTLYEFTLAPSTAVSSGLYSGARQRYDTIFMPQTFSSSVTDFTTLSPSSSYLAAWDGHSQGDVLYSQLMQIQYSSTSAPASVTGFRWTFYLDADQAAGTTVFDPSSNVFAYSSVQHLVVGISTTYEAWPQPVQTVEFGSEGLGAMAPYAYASTTPVTMSTAQSVVSTTQPYYLFFGEFACGW